MKIGIVVLVGIAVLVVVAVLVAAGGGAVPTPIGGLLAALLASTLLLATRRHASSVALALGAVTVVVGLAFAASDVVEAVDDRAVEVRGQLDVREILSLYHPFERPPDALTRFERRGDAESSYLTAADGVTRKFDAPSGLLVLWSLGELAPWLLAGLSLILVGPLLRSAERGDPFLPSAATRLGGLGAALLVGIPMTFVLQWMSAERAAGSGAAPIVSPSLSLSLLHFLPGLGLLVLAGVFRSGAELREFERHAI